VSLKLKSFKKKTKTIFFLYVVVQIEEKMALVDL